MTLGDYSRISLIVPKVEQETPDAVVRFLARCLEREGLGLPDTGPNIGIWERRMQEAPLVRGCALPHLRHRRFHRLAFALGRCQPALCWPGANATTVELIFLWAIPEPDDGSYLRALSQLSRLCADVARLERLRQAAGAEAMYTVLNEFAFPA